MDTQQLFTVLLVLHIAGGSLGLLTGTIAAAVTKGSKLHNLSGRLFFYGMLTASVSALIMSNLPLHYNVFLFTIGGFTLYMISSGYRIVHVQRNVRNKPKPAGLLDYAITIFGAVFTGFLLLLATKGLLAKNMFAIVPAVFAGVCINYLVLDVKLLTGKHPVKMAWIQNHISRMMGALIASYTAFLVVNVQIQQQWLLWLLPSLIGGILIARFLRKFAPKR